MSIAPITSNKTPNYLAYVNNSFKKMKENNAINKGFKNIKGTTLDTSSSFIAWKKNKLAKV